MSANHLPLTGDQAANRLSVGQKVLNRYVLRHILGQGGMGTVWLARDEDLELDIALKFVPSLITSDLVVLSDLKRETRRNLTLTHPHIVRTYDFVQDSTLAGISMEYMDAGNLRNQRLDQPSGVFQPADLAEWTHHLLDALDYAHQTASIVHRDLKPANLLLNQRGQLKVADFGIARSLGESMTQLTGRNTSNGTLLYMSPQQLEGDPAHALDDVYGVGATLYELCTSRPPFFSGDIARQVLQKAPPSMAERRAELEIPAGNIPQNWEATVAACLAKERADRPQSVREIAARLGLKEAAAVRLTTKTLPITRALPVTAPRTAGAATAPVAVTSPVEGAEPPKWQAYLDTAKQHGSTLLDTVKRQGPVLVDTVKHDRRVAFAAVGGGVLLLIALLCVGLLGRHGDRPSPGRAKMESGTHPRGTNPAPAPTPAAPPSTARGGVFVQTEPAGAMAQIDGHASEKTPVMLEDLTPGRHELRVALDGYDDYTSTVEVKGGQLVPAGKIALVPSTGTLAVTTNPPGLDIVVRGPGSAQPEARHTSPWNSDKLPVGEYEIFAVRPGWEPTVQKVSLTRAQALPVTFELTGGAVEINSAPDKATVLADGKPVGTTPYVAHDVQPGEVKYTVAFPGYGNSEVSGQVAPGQTLTLDAKLLTVAAAGAAAGEPPPEADSAKAARAEHSEGGGRNNADDQHRSRSKKSSRPRPEKESGILSKLKRLPIPFWHH